MKKTCFFPGLIALILVTASCLPAAHAAQTDDMITDVMKKIPEVIKNVPEKIRNVAIYSIQPDPQGRMNIDNLQDQIITALLETGRFSVIDRKSLKALLLEQQLSMTGVVDTSEMVRTGRIIGIQGFFYGSVEMTGEKLILNLKLIDVETSAILFSKKLTGETYDYVRIGFGIGYYKSAVSNTMNLILDETGNYETIVSEDQPGLSAASFFNFTFSYKQGFKAIRWAQFGTDLRLAFSGAVDGSEIRNIGDLKNVTIWGYDNNIGYDCSFQIMDISVTPKLYLSSKGIFGSKHDWLNPYFGLSLGIINFSYSCSAWKSNPQAEGNGSASIQVFLLAPVIGAEANLTRSLSLYAEGRIIMKDKVTTDAANWFLEGINIRNMPVIDAGLNLNMGIKYYLNVF